VLSKEAKKENCELVRLFPVGLSLPLFRPEIAGSGFLLEQFVDFGGTPEEKSSNLSEIGKIRLKGSKGVRSAPKTRNLWIKTTQNSINQEIDPMQFWGKFFWIFKNFGGNHKSRRDPWQPKAFDTI
jgi:hypothetical protein